jgi:hypothetical protein
MALLGRSKCAGPAEATQVTNAETMTCAGVKRCAGDSWTRWEHIIKHTKGVHTAIRFISRSGVTKKPDRERIAQRRSTDNPTFSWEKFPKRAEFCLVVSCLSGFQISRCQGLIFASPEVMHFQAVSRISRQSAQTNGYAVSMRTST